MDRLINSIKRNVGLKCGTIEKGKRIAELEEQLRFAKAEVASTHVRGPVVPVQSTGNVEDLRCCTRGGNGRFDGESMVALVG